MMILTILNLILLIAIFYFLRKFLVVHFGKLISILLIIILFPVSFIGSEIIILPRIESKFMTFPLASYDIVIKAIDSYYFEKKKYPFYLDELIPEYLQGIPPLPDIKVEEVTYNFDPSSKDIYLPFAGANKPPYILTFIGNRGISGDLIVRYCPVQYDCSYIAKISHKNGSRVETKTETVQPIRIDKKWVRLTYS